MSREWGRESYAGEWPSRKPVGIILALVIAIASVAAIEAIQYKQQWTFAQRFYLARYIQTGLAGTLRKQGYYTMLAVVDRRGFHRIVFADELAPATLPNGEQGEALTQAAVDRGAASKAIVLLIFAVCLYLPGCRRSRTIWSAESRSPDGKIVATARTVARNEGLSIISGTDTSVYLRWATGSRGSTQILELADASDAPVDTNVEMRWLTPTHLELTYKGNQTVVFQAVKWVGVDIAVQDLSSEKPQTGSASRGAAGPRRDDHDSQRSH